MHKLKIVECFKCVQGEGVNAGTPSILVRFLGCNLKCSWCDTKYALTTTQNQNTILQSPEELAKTIYELSGNKISNIIISGGEPLLQPFHTIAPFLPKHFTYEIESNATLIPPAQFADFSDDVVKNFQWNLSPKGNNAKQQTNTLALQYWANLAKTHEKIFFKFVIRKSHCDNDILEAITIIEKLSINYKRIIFMPEGTSKTSQCNTAWLIQKCIDHGIKFSPRLHIIVFGSKRGV